MLGCFLIKHVAGKLQEGRARFVVNEGKMNPIFFDVPRLMELAKSNPKELERLRQQEIENLINQAPEHMRTRLRGLQFQIDCKRQLHKHPLGACVEISRMMLDSLQNLNLAAQGELKSHRLAQKTHESAAVIPFPALAH